jgi:beta-lactamase superfamily II metal-dependent hydrolase
MSFSRRRFLATASLTTGALYLHPRFLFAAEESPVTIIRREAATAKIQVQNLRGNVSVLIGSGGNIAVLTGRDGKVLIDAGIPASRPQLTEALKSLGDDPIKHLINTHWHFDHTDGNEWLHSIGAEITAHENTRKHLSATTRVEDWNFTFPTAPEGALPTKIFKTDENLHLNRTTLELKNTIRQLTPTPTSPSSSLMPIFSTPAILSGTAIFRSLTTARAAASTVRFGRLK